MPQKFLKLIANLFLTLVFMQPHGFGCFDWAELGNSATSADLQAVHPSFDQPSLWSPSHIPLSNIKVSWGKRRPHQTNEQCTSGKHLRSMRLCLSPPLWPCLEGEQGESVTMDLETLEL